MKYLNHTLCLLLFLFISSCVVSDDDGLTNEPEPDSISLGLIGHWDFDGNADDLSAKENHGVIAGARLSNDRNGKSNAAYSFDGVDDFINVGGSRDLLLSFGGVTSYTISAWVKPQDVDYRNIFISKFDGGVSAGWYLARETDGHIQSYRNVTPWAAKSLQSYNENAWMHCLASYDGSRLKIYVNGQIQADDPFAPNTTDLSTDILIGASHSGGSPTNFYKGDIDEIRLYNRALTETEIAFLANN